MNDLDGFWQFPDNQVAECLIDLVAKTKDLDYLLPDSDEGGYLITFDNKIVEQMAQRISQVAACYLKPTSAMMDHLIKSVHAYTFEWDDEECTLEVIQKA